MTAINELAMKNHTDTRTHIARGGCVRKMRTVRRQCGSFVFFSGARREWRAEWSVLETMRGLSYLIVSSRVLSIPLPSRSRGAGA